jgi:hypothetical protein
MCLFESHSSRQASDDFNWCFLDGHEIPELGRLRARALERPVRWRLRAWHAVRILSGPPLSPTFAEISRRLANRPQLAGFAARPPSLSALIWIWKAVSPPYSLASKSRFPETETAAAETGSTIVRPGQ